MKEYPLNFEMGSLPEAIAAIPFLTPEQSHAYWAALYRFVARLLAQRLEAATLKLARAEQMLAEARRKR